MAPPTPAREGREQDIMTTPEMIAQLEWTIMTGGLDRQTRDVLRAEKEALEAAWTARTRDMDAVRRARKEAVRVAEMWGAW